ncbi:protein of unknown function [Paenibacillus alvei]|uniref:Uncharacterized protein n=1 Tax=Paenibacillus alvei TaxID=44250 RepID=A0A383R9G5_PAEAL|nr:protein of unknown function [Paenibacillus alvei]
MIKAVIELDAVQITRNLDNHFSILFRMIDKMDEVTCWISFRYKKQSQKNVMPAIPMVLGLCRFIRIRKILE